MVKIYRDEAVEAALKRLPGEVSLSSPVSISAFTVFLVAAAIMAFSYSASTKFTSTTVLTGYVSHRECCDVARQGGAEPSNAVIAVNVQPEDLQFLPVGQPLTLIANNLVSRRSVTLKGAVIAVLPDPITRTMGPLDAGPIVDTVYRVEIALSNSDFSDIKHSVIDQPMQVQIKVKGETKTLMNWFLNAVRPA